MRIAVWGCAIRSRGWTDYELDLAFENDDGTVRGDPENRNRIFERVRTNRSLPMPKKGERHIVDRVDAHSIFHGTAKPFRSPYWTLTASEPPISVFEQGLNCMKMLPITEGRIDWEAIVTLVRDPQTYFACHQAKALEYLLKNRVADFDLLAYLGAKFRIAEFMHDNQLALICYADYIEILKMLCAQTWLRPVSAELLRFAQERIHISPQRAAVWAYFSPFKAPHCLPPETT